MSVHLEFPIIVLQYLHHNRRLQLNIAAGSSAGRDVRQKDLSSDALMAKIWLL